MKKGFTLAEVLITLAIIGVIATLTLPALMTNTNEQQARAALKKAVSTLTDAAQMSAVNEGFDYSAISSASTTDSSQYSLWALFTNQLSVNKAATGNGKNGKTKGNAASFDNANYTMFLNDNTSITFNPGANMTNAYNNKIQTDEIVYGIPIIYDINGAKGPNILSNCAGTLTAATEDSGNCSDKQKRVIKDQYALRLRGNMVVPNGPAARYVYEK